MPELIRPELLTEKDAEKIIRFFDTQSKLGNHVWKKNTTYTFYDGTEFQFAYDVVERKREKNKSEVRYEFVSDKIIGEGQFGVIHEVAGTLALKEGDIHFKQAGHNGKTRVVKIQSHIKSRELAVTEYNLSREAAHMAVKEPTIDGSTTYSVMRKLKGRELAVILEEDNSKKNPLTVQQRLALTKALMKALKEQVSDCDIIHRDIKPQNILVDLDEPISVNIIDYGMSEKADKINRYEVVGSPAYIAPQIWSSLPYTVKADVFSMARVIALLWHTDIKSYGTTRGSFMHISKEQPKLLDLFKEIDDINPENKQIIETILNGMLQPREADRFSIEQAITSGEEIDITNNKGSEAIVAKLLKLTQEYKVNLSKQPNEEQKMPIISHLELILKETNKPQDKIKAFYTYLDRASASDTKLKNIDVIKKDNTLFTINFLKGLALIAATLATGILPGLLISGIVYKVTGKHPRDLFEGEGQQFEKKIELVKGEHKLYAAFFQPEPESEPEDSNPDQLANKSAQ